jgi:glutamate formiminotransferase
MRLIECVPNFSEGRDAAAVDSIVAAMLAVPGVFLLAREMDADHNRSVITLAGEPGAVAEAAVRGAGQAANVIDLRRHQGAHPRIGATDVIPFVPLEGTTLEECVALAEWAGRQLWERHGIPVYLYEAAARSPERRNLETHRKGQFEGLREAVRDDPARRPDFGPPELHPSAGATLVGARKFLIAYNINLDTDNLEIAKQIARTIRTSSGGLPAVKAMGVALAAKHCAQVSMNLTDFETTSLATAWNAVNDEARKLGARGVESELIGLAPRKALEQAAAELLRFDVFNADMVIENRVAAVMAARRERLGAQLQPFLAELASEAPAPGGGSAAAAAGAMAAALGRMVTRLVAAKTRKAQGDAAPFDELEQRYAAVETELVRAVDQDSDAFLAIVAARRLPKATPADQQARAQAIEAATLGAAETPLRVAALCRELQALGARLAPLIPAVMASDLSTAGGLAEAGFAGAAANVAINLDALPADHAGARRIRGELERLRGLAGLAGA